MIKIILGIVLLLLPFLFVTKFEDKVKGFFYVFTFWISFHLFLAIVLQLFGIFNYWLVLSFNIALCLFVLFSIDFGKIFKSFKKIKFDWFFVAIILVLFLTLLSINYNYSGVISTVNEGYVFVENFSYDYPYFSDEWVGISLIDYSISSGKLPFVNTLWHERPFANVGFAIHSFSSEIFLLSDLDPLDSFIYVSLIFGIVICSLVYFVLRFNGVGKLSSGIAALSVPYIVQGANLPGLWTFIPVSMGIVCLLLSFLFISIKNQRMFLFSSFLTVLFYPPLILFSAFAFLGYFIFNKKDKNVLIKYSLVLVLSVVILFILALFSGQNDFLNFIFDKIFYESFAPGHSIFPFLKIIPFWIVPLGLLGFFSMSKKNSYVFSAFGIGAVFWILYSFVDWRFLIGFERNIFVSSILFVLIAGFGFEKLFKILGESFKSKINWDLILKILVLVLFFVASFFYASHTQWSGFVAYDVNTGAVYNPSSPINNYLSEEDLVLFEDIEGKNFLSHPWKGLVIGAATGNYPLHSKSSTLGVYETDYFEFLRVDCEDKKRIAEEFEIDYVYSQEFDCSGFDLEGSSSEGFYLYEVGF